MQCNAKNIYRIVSCYIRVIYLFIVLSHAAPRPAILTALKTSETTGVLNLSGLNLHGRPAQAVFRSLNDTSGSGQLKELILSECSLFDEDVEELGAVLDSLSGTLSNLDLSCNGISPQGVRTLCNRTSQGVSRYHNIMTIDVKLT